MTRRSFLDLLVSAVRTAVAVLAAVPIVRFLVAPLRAETRMAGFVRLLPLSAIGPGETKRAVVESDRWDAFTHHPSGPIGSVWLIREDTGEGEARVRCLQSICPHLGCAVDQGSAGGGFRCPCHGAVFNGKGKRVEGPSPRDMDELEVRMAKGDDGETWVEVRYRTFVSGAPNKKALA